MKSTDVFKSEKNRVVIVIDFFLFKLMLVLNITEPLPFYDLSGSQPHSLLNYIRGLLVATG